MTNPNPNLSEEAARLQGLIDQWNNAWLDGRPTEEKPRATGGYVSTDLGTLIVGQAWPPSPLWVADGKRISVFSSSSPPPEESTWTAIQDPTAVRELWDQLMKEAFGIPQEKLDGR